MAPRPAQRNGRVEVCSSPRPNVIVKESKCQLKNLHISRRLLPLGAIRNFTALFYGTSTRQHCTTTERLWLGNPLRSSLIPCWKTQSRCKGTSSEGVRSSASGTIGVQWITFAGFYEKKIIKDFIQSASKHSLTGFLAHGKPALACLEGNPEDIKEFIRHVRTTVFATVPRSARKMSLSLCEPDSTSRPRRFEAFEAKAFYSLGAHHRPDFLDRRQLEDYLKDHGVPESVFREVSH